MKNNLLFVIVMLLIGGSITSCKKEPMDELNSPSIPSDKEDLTGEKLPLLSAGELSKYEGIKKLRQGSIESNAKNLNLSNLTLNTGGLQLRSRAIHPLECGSDIAGELYSESNTSNIYTNGRDRIYKLVLTKDDILTLRLYQLSSDLDVFLADLVRDAYGREFIGSVRAHGSRGGVSEENIKTSLKAGEYYIIVEEYNAPSAYRLSLECQASKFTLGCEDFQKLTPSYDLGITRQSKLWELWSNNPNNHDGLVLYENSFNNNVVVKFDYGRFRYQDVVRSLVGLPLSNGLYTMSFKMYVPTGYKGSFVTEKSKSFGSYQGIAVEMENGRFKFTHMGRTIYTRKNIPHDKWLPVSLTFDLIQKRVYFYSQGVRVVFNSEGMVGQKGKSINSIYGVDFYTYHQASKFNLDDVCVREYIPGLDDPNKIILASDVLEEEIDMSNE